MDIKDWRKAQENTSQTNNADSHIPNKYRGRGYEDYISQQIREAEARGEFDNLPGAGKPLNLETNPYVGDNAMSYHLLKSNGFAPKEIELAKEIRVEYERAEARLKRLRHQSQALRTRRVPPFPSEKRAYNAAVEKATADYEFALRDLNRKILILNLSAPPPMHQPLLEVEKKVQQFRDSCPLLT